ncbi:MAG TPA: two-component regulator propeller domain-containing protein [Terracidiphilus sp.]|nr:two-component regulator propeller domain-containing protein [Terracidiphilus sp.]
MQIQAAEITVEVRGPGSSHGRGRALRTILAFPATNPEESKPRRPGRRAGLCAAKGCAARFCAVVLLAAACATGSAVGWALEPTTPLAQYGRQSWVMENGLPQNTIHALAQTPDGFVWLGTEVGLVRFDGHSFAVFDRNSTPALPSGDIRCLWVSGDGALWVGTADGLVRWKNGKGKVFGTAEGLPGESIRALGENADGGLWVVTDSGVARQAGDRFVTAGSRQPGAVIRQGSADGTSGAWVQGPGQATGPAGEAWKKAAAAAGMAQDGIGFVAVLPGGALAVATNNRLAVVRGATVTARMVVGKELPGSRIQALYADREGSLWIGTNGGLVRWVDGTVQRLPVTDPLATASILSMMEDREGDLWVGTETSGLDILRNERFRVLGVREGLSSDNTTTVVEDSRGTLWVGTGDSGLNALPWSAKGPGKDRVYTVKDGLLSNVILALAPAPNGDVWVGTPDGLSLIRNGRVQSFTSADGLADDFVRSLLVDKDGTLWVGTRHGLTHWTDAPTGRQMVTYTQATGLGSDLVGAMARDGRGNLWVATLAGLSRLASGKIVNYTTADGLSSNVVTSLLARRNGTLLIGTQDHGWNLWDGARFSAPKDNRLTETSIHAILADASNHLWFATDEGIARCDCTMTADCTNWVEFGPADGLRSRETATNSHPSAWRGRDGRLWFATPKGLAEVNPAHFPFNRVPPPVELERFTLDDVDQPLHGEAARLKIPAGHVHFQFEYAGLSFVAPQKVRYRYMLEGFDHHWTKAGTRRTAYYTNIPPGRYTFRVQAANNDGLWNTKGAALPFVLEPHFYQTIWFYLLLAAALGGLVLLVLRRRLMLAEREFAAVLGERNRIAREIHDTLAQGYVGISVQLEVLAELLRHQKLDAAAKQLDATQTHVRDGLADARQSIWALRSQDSGEKTLPVHLRRLTEQAGGHGLEATFNLFGAYRPLPADAEREILRIAQEAIHNVKRHAGAKHLWVQMEYGPTEAALEVRDDGRGFAAGSGAGSPPGHFGLTGMRERAAAIGGTLEIESEPGTGTGAGTAVRLRAPAPKQAKE